MAALINAQFLLAGTELAPGRVPEAPPELQLESFGDWAVVCGISSADPSERVCEATTMIVASGQTAPLRGLHFCARMRVIAIMSVAVSIPPGVQFALAPGTPDINLTYKYCVVAACFAEAEIDEEQLVTLRNRP